MLFLQFFQSWAFLFGLSAASIPIILHLIYRRRAPRIRFSTLRFLKISNQRTAARRRIQNLLLLLLRALLLALLAIALAGPLLPSSHSNLFRRAPTSVALVLDNSYSMATRTEGGARFQRARDLARSALDKLALGDSVAVLLAAPRRTDPAAALSEDLNEAAVCVTRADVSNARGDLVAVVRNALALLAESPNRNRELYVFTDLQKSAWSLESEDVRAALQEHPEIPAIIIDVGEGSFVNTSILSAEVSAAARVVNSPLSVKTALQNSSPRTAEQQVSFFLGGQKIDEKSVRLEPGTTLSLTFQHRVESAGVHTGEVRLSEDALGVDNRAFFVVETRRQIEAVIFRSDASAISFYTPEFYLSLALNPFGPYSEEGSIRTRAADLHDAAQVLGEQIDVAFLCLTHLTAGNLAPLSQFVYGGGSLVLFPTASVDLSELQRIASHAAVGGAGERFLPGTFTGPRSAAAYGKPFLAIGSYAREHPMFEFVSSPELLRPVRVYSWLAVDLPAGTGASPLVALENGDPLLVLHSYGRGRVVLFLTTADPSWSNLPLTNVFLPFLHRMCHWLAAQDGSTQSYLVGTPVRFTFPQVIQPMTVRVTSPDGTVSEVISRSTAASNEALFLDTDLPGVYEYSIAGESGGTFVVNPDPAEADLERLPMRTLQDAFGSRPLFRATNVDDLAQTIDRLRQGVSLQLAFFIVVLILLLIEAVISNLAARRTARATGASTVSAFANRVVPLADAPDSV